MFDWCKHNKHDECHREYERFYFDDKGRIVRTGEVITCQCTKRGCKCYVKPGERTKKKKKITRA